MCSSPGPPAEGPGMHPEGDGQGSCFFLRVPAGGGGVWSKASFKHQLLVTLPAVRKGVGSLLKASFLWDASSSSKAERRWEKKKGGGSHSEGVSLTAFQTTAELVKMNSQDPPRSQLQISSTKSSCCQL